MKKTLVLLAIASVFLMFSCNKEENGGNAPGNASYDSVQAITANGVTFKMIKVDGGTFTMGAPSTEEYTDEWERPQHAVTVSTFYISETEVTQELWQAVMGRGVQDYWRKEYDRRVAAGETTDPFVDYTSNWGRGDNYPMYDITYFDCDTFMTRLNALTHKHFRMPTEAEWEFAARGGNKSNGYVYPGSDTPDEVAWHMHNSGDHTHLVKGKLPNELGLYDMGGNVSEWTSDWRGNYSSMAQTNPQGPATGTWRTVRGGNYYSYPRYSRVASRLGNKPEGAESGCGLRLVMVID
jgi:formylglycine-generating enzyme required for sulfatase activity